LRFEEFEKAANARWETVPPEYKVGVDGLIVERDARAHPRMEEIYTLGECITESYPSDYGGPETTRSAVVLYYGSFLRLSQVDAAFNWEEELWETLTHELQHHLEGLASEDDLEDFDYAVDENFKRLEGERFDPLFFRAGEAMAAGTFKVEQDIFIEVDAAAGSAEHEFEWSGARYRVMLPSGRADVTFVRVLGDVRSEEVDLWIVMVRARGAYRALKDALLRRALEVAHTEATSSVSSA